MAIALPDFSFLEISLQDINTWVSGLISGVLSSFIFLWALRIYSPRVVISDVISFGKNSRGVKTYRIKVANMRRRAIFLPRVSLHVVRLPDPNNPDFIKTDEIELIRSEPFVIGKYRRFRPRKSGSFRFATSKDIHAAFDAEDFHCLRFRIVVRDSLSSVEKLFERRFLKSADVLHERDFRYGSSVRLVAPAKQGEVRDVQ